MNPRLFTFIAGAAGAWRVTRVAPVVGESVAPAERLDLVPGAPPLPSGAAWALRGVTSNERYATRPEKNLLVAASPPLGRPEATRAALIPIRKRAEWWAMTQDERRAIFEESSNHTQIGLEFLPAVARRLHHCRDLADGQPFDFLTWFEFAPEHADAFESLVARLRATPEWAHVEREVDIRLERDRA